MSVSELALAGGIALIFDLDGVLVDSMPFHTLAWQRYLKQLGVDGEDVAKRMHGRRNDELVRDFLGPDVPAHVVSDARRREGAAVSFHDGPRTQRQAGPGIASLLSRAKGVPVALATNAEPANVAFLLDGAGLRRWFQAIADGSQVENAKPAPDIYLLAAGQLGVAPRNCIVFEDSPVGIAAARAAGMRVVGVQTHSQRLENVDLAVQDFLDPELEPWLASQRVL